MRIIGKVPFSTSHRWHFTVKKLRMNGLQGVQWVKDEAGKLAEIRVDAMENPELAKEVYHLIQVLSRARDTERAKAFRESSRAIGANDKPISATKLTKLIREAKASGEISQEQFFQRFPEWQKNVG